VVSITQLAKKENTLICNGYIFLMAKGSRPALNASKPWEKLNKFTKVKRLTELSNKAFFFYLFI